MGNVSGNKGRFSERLKKIRLSKIKKPQSIEEDKAKEQERKYHQKSLLKIALALPLMVYDNIADKQITMSPTENKNKPNSSKKIVKVKSIPDEKYEQIDKKINRLKEEIDNKQKQQDKEKQEIEKMPEQETFSPQIEDNISKIEKIKETTSQKNNTVASKAIMPILATVEIKNQVNKEQDKKNNKEVKNVKANNQLKNNIINSSNKKNDKKAPLKIISSKENPKIIPKLSNKNSENKKNEKNKILSTPLKVKKIKEVPKKSVNQKEILKTSPERQKIEQLQKEIINRIKKDLVKSINEYEVLQSELYVLSCLDNNDTELKQCQENIKEIKKLLSKVKTLKEKYDYLKENLDFEYLLSIDDNHLVDKIIELREVCNNETLHVITEDYKILDEYKYLYEKIDKLHEKTADLEIKKLNKEEELRQRDIDYDKFKDKIYDMTKINETFNRFTEEQNRILKELNENISKIDQNEEINYRLKGLGALIGNSFKYIGLMLASPLKGLIPGIATQAIFTKNAISNIYQNLEYKEERKMVYKATDYSSVISNAIYNLDYTNMEIDSALSSIIDLKKKYKSEFEKYSNEFPEYRESIRKLNKMEQSIMNTKIKLDIVRDNLKEKEQQNKDKMKKVRKLNDNEGKL